MSSCTNGHPLGAGDAFCAECGASAATAKACANGHAMQPGDTFCQECGALAAVASAPEPEPPTEPTPTASVAPPPVAPPARVVAPAVPAAAAAPAAESAGKRRVSPVMILAGLIVVLAAILVVLLLTRDGGESTKTVAIDASRSTTTTRASTTTRALSSATTAVVDARHVFFGDLDVLLVQSSESRGQLSDALAALNSCVDPTPVASQIRQIEDARDNEIDQVGQLDPPDAETQALVRTLLTALTNSRDSDRVYYGLVTAMGQCAPIGAGASAAEATDLAASAAKREFVAAYNPSAASYGLKSDWREDQI